MNDDLKNKPDELPDDFLKYVSNTNCILQAINDLSEKMDKVEAESKKKDKTDFKRFVFSSVIGLLTLAAGIVAAVAAVLAILPH